MNDYDRASESGYRCFRCQSGCVHMICGQLMLTLAPEQFLLFADTVSAMRRQMIEERDFSRAFGKSDGIVM